MMGNELIGNTLGMVMNLSLTVISIGIIFVLLAGYFWSTTKGKSVSLSLGIVIAIVLYDALVSTSLFQSVFTHNLQGFLINLPIFAVLAYISTRITHSYVHGKFTSEMPKKIFHVVFLAIATEGVILSVCYRTLGLESFYNLSSIASYAFGTSYSLLFWLAALFGTLFLIKSRR